MTSYLPAEASIPSVLAILVVVSSGLFSSSPPFFRNAKVSLFFGFLVVLFLLLPPSNGSSPSLAPDGSDNEIDSMYAEARRVRALQGHEAAQPLYQSLLERDDRQDDDWTAATRLAAATTTPQRQDQACKLIAIVDDTKNSDDDYRETIQKLHHWLIDKVGYTHSNLQKHIFVPSRPIRQQHNNDDDEEPSENYCSVDPPMGPVYVTPVKSGIASPPSLDSDLHTLAAMFLIGFCVPKDRLDPELVDLLIQLGLAFPCEYDPNVLVPHVHLFPLSIPSTNSGDKGIASSDDDLLHLIFATDLHPLILSSTTVGSTNNGAVMYIGPDSLALVQHLVPHYGKLILPHHCKSSDPHPLEVLDVCCGSGIQALTCLLASTVSWSRATCVDINPRALQFTRFNVILNGLDDDRVELALGNVVEDEDVFHIWEACAQQQQPTTMILSKRKFDVLLANPPFIPTPPSVEGTRYGLFSSGGQDGEQVLRAILKMASRCTRIASPKLERNLEQENLINHGRGGLVAIVSEFMNPHRSSELVAKLERWSTDNTEQEGCGESSSWSGFLFTNQFPVDAITYSQRRADTEEEYELWLKHLRRLDIESVSPGLLFLKRERAKVQSANLQRIIPMEVPKTALGSIWTPINRNSIAFVGQVLRESSFFSFGSG